VLLYHRNEGAGRNIYVGIVFNTVVEGNDVQHIQVLPLVLVNAFHLDVE